MTEHHNNLIQQFRSNIQDIITPLHTDDILLKFLRARNFDLEEAEINFRDVDSTRKFYGIDTVLEKHEPNEVFEKYSTDCFLGFAKDGTAVRYICAKIDFVGFIQSASTYQLYRYFCYVIESDLKRLRDETLKGSPYCDEVTYIIDMEGFSLSDVYHKCVIENGLDNFHQFQNFYPEVWRRILVVNVSSVYDIFYALFKPIFRDTLIQKIQMANKNSTKDLLLKYIDETVLPASLGGSRVDSTKDPRCKEFMRIGGRIPDKYFLKNCTRCIEPTDPGVKVAVIGPRSVLNIPLIIRKAPIRNKLELQGQNGSIYLTVFYREFGPNPENPDLPEAKEILDPRNEHSNVVTAASKMRCQIHLAPNGGMGLFTKPGIYILQLDNTSSWFGSRKVMYRITSLPAEK